MVLLVWYNICEKIVFREKIGSSKHPLGVERIRIFPSASKKYSLIRDGDRERERVMDMKCPIFRRAQVFEHILNLSTFSGIFTHWLHIIYGYLGSFLNSNPIP